MLSNNVGYKAWLQTEAESSLHKLCTKTQTSADLTVKYCTENFGHFLRKKEFRTLTRFQLLARQKRVQANHSASSQQNIYSISVRSIQYQNFASLGIEEGILVRWRRHFKHLPNPFTLEQSNTKHLGGSHHCSLQYVLLVVRALKAWKATGCDEIRLENQSLEQ